ncbi:MAG: hypothetical protein R8G66_19665 [Cytophagales bacterium]|nr:hypothetical protein [Cytophagales bacterium]
MRFYFSFFLSTILFGCQIEQEPVRSIGMGHVRSVATTFISHQNDTQQKRDQIVSVAAFNPDGTLIDVTNHLSYPYDYSEPFKVVFWTEPNGDALVHVMDGLFMGGNWNFLYGNDWPRKYADVTEEKRHPRYGDFSDSNYGRFKSTVPLRDQGLPLTINTEASFDAEGRIQNFFKGYEEKFEFEGVKVTLFETTTLYNTEFFRSVEGEEAQVKIKHPQRSVKQEYFEYEGERLSIHRIGDKEYKYFYEGDRLIRSEFHLRGKMRNHRLYFYNEQGLKEKTEIFNTFGEPEYTIEYHYDFYEES